MRAKEFIASIVAEPKRDEQTDEKSELYDRPRLTLRALNKLRKIRELRRLERAERAEEIKAIYGRNSDDSDDHKPPMIPRETH